jgi:hypothetical protein
MSQKHPIPRILRSVPLPQEVIEAIREVSAAIKRGDENTTFPSDDCIQIGCLCGGLMDEHSDRFYFSVHLDDNRPYTWDIALFRSEIDAISEGDQSSLDLWCCSNPDCGFKSYIEHITCSWCDYGQSREWPPPATPPLTPDEEAKVAELIRALEETSLTLQQTISEQFSSLLNRKAEQDGAGQPGTRPESKLEGGDKPQPDAEGRSQ